MPEQSIIAWDLETVPDLAAAARMLDLGNAADADVREALGPGFPKHPLHKIVCIGALVASRQPEGWRVDALGAPHVGERTEAELISAFAEKVAKLRPQLVTWNGHSFDLPERLCLSHQPMSANEAATATAALKKKAPVGAEAVQRGRKNTASPL
jgi:predicted PolB exonuclease-like 3'-5' exonuclease